MIYVLIYGVALLAVFAVALAGDEDTLVKLQAVAVGHWIAYNIVVLKFGWEHTGVLLVALSCAAAIWSAWIGFRPRSWIALGIVGLWIVAAAISTGFYCFRNPGSYVYHLGLNLTFVARMLVVGVAGVVELVRRLGPVPHWAGSRRLVR